MTCVTGHAKTIIASPIGSPCSAGLVILRTSHLRKAPNSSVLLTCQNSNQVSRISDGIHWNLVQLQSSFGSVYRQQLARRGPLLAIRRWLRSLIVERCIKLHGSRRISEGHSVQPQPAVSIQATRSLEIPPQSSLMPKCMRATPRGDQIGLQLRRDEWRRILHFCDAVKSTACQCPGRRLAMILSRFCVHPQAHTNRGVGFQQLYFSRFTFSVKVGYWGSSK
ncbi:hypothetical protein CC79DRAFT_79494 [Sarocladium strictum]